jgi:hypothetical protein
MPLEKTATVIIDKDKAKIAPAPAVAKKGEVAKKTEGRLVR